MSHSDINKTVRVQVTPKYGKDLATNNFAAVLDDPNGARCYHCFGYPKITKETMTFDGSTVFCPLCRVDAVVPVSKIPHPVNKSLKLWNKYWFSVDAYNSEEEEFFEFEEEDNDEVQKDSDNAQKKDSTFQYSIEKFPLLA